MSLEASEDIGDFDISFEEGEAKSDQVPKEPKKEDNAYKDTQNNTQNKDHLADNSQNIQDDDSVKIPRSEFEKMQNSLSQIEKERYYDQTIASLKDEFTDFDVNAVIEKLKEIHKSDPNKAVEYNTPMGFRAIWLDIQRNAAKNDAVNSGESKGGGVDFNSLMDGAMQNKPGALKKAITMSI